MIADLAAQRAEREAEREAAALAKAKGWKAARRNFLILCVPIVLGVAFVIYSCGYYSGYLDGILATHRK